MPAPFEWGTDVVRRDRFLQYEPRRRRVTELLDDAARWAARDHLVQGDRRLSFADVFAGVGATAGLLHHHGVAPGDRVLLLAANSPEWVLTFWGGMRAGAIMALGNGWWSEEEAAHAVRLLDPTLVVGDPKRLAKLPAGTPALEMDAVREAAEAGGAEELPRPEGEVLSRPGGTEDEPALVVFTSGTTGLPKGAVLSHRSVIANLHNLCAVSGRLPQQVPDDAEPAVSLLSGPLFHIGGVQGLCLGMLGGSTLVFLSGRFDPGEVLDLLEREAVTVWNGVPTMALRVLDHPSLPERDLSKVRSISLGGSVVPAELVGRLHQALPNARKGVSTIYGMTELGGTVAAASGRLMAEHPSTSGRALAVAEIKIADPGPDGTGEILVRTPGQMSGYYRGPDADGSADAEVFDPDGFVRTGDLGRLDDGLLFITGRSKDMVIRGGENIAAAHVESVLLGHPSVSVVAVVGLPHPELGEQVGAAVVPAAGATLSAGELAAYATERLAHFEVPSKWWVHPGPLPTNDTGKLDKRAIKAAWPG